MYTKGLEVYIEMVQLKIFWNVKEAENAGLLDDQF
jgi:hypothetical protein